MKMQKIKTISAISRILAIMFAIGLSSPSYGYTYWKCLGEKLKWNGNSATFQAGQNSFPVGSARRDALSAVRSHWNQTPSKFNFGNIQWNAGVGVKNGQNEVWYSNDSSLTGGAPAVAKMLWSCYWFFGNHVSLKEVDVVMDNSVNWSSGTSLTAMTSYGGTKRPARTTLMHEFGHAIGLAHTNNTYNIMGSDTTHVHANNGKIRSYGGEDAGNGAVALYGVDPNGGEDVAVSHWKYKGVSGEYSSHQRTRLYNSTGASEVSWNSNTVDGRRYNVNKGGTYQAQFTYENNGESFQNPNLAFYISTNNNITTADTKIREGSLSLSRDQVYTAKSTVTIPSNLTSGQTYYLGVIIDWDNKIGEVTGANNATYLAIRVN